jgi:hypothetical protein
LGSWKIHTKCDFEELKGTVPLEVRELGEKIKSFSTANKNPAIGAVAIYLTS